jgi:integrase
LIGATRRRCSTALGRLSVCGLEESTRREYEISGRLHVMPMPIARVWMRDLGAPDVRDWLGQFERRRASPTVIRKAKAALSVMLACAVEDGDLGSNRAAGVRYVPTEQAKREHPKIERRALTAADVVAILNAMSEQWRAFFTLLAQTGMRIGELRRVQLCFSYELGLEKWPAR